MMHVSRDLVEKMASGTHFAKEVGMNMTGLAELLEQCSDTVFTVQFHKQPSKESAQELLSATNFKDLKDKKKVAELAKELSEGGLTTMTCHLVDVENNLGRSTVILRLSKINWPIKFFFNGYLGLFSIYKALFFLNTSKKHCVFHAYLLETIPTIIDHLSSGLIP